MEVKEIKEQFEKVVAYSQGIPQPKIDELFDNWLEGKRDFIEAFGGKLIIEYPEKVSFELSPKEKNSRISDFIDTVCCRYDNVRLADFIESNRDGFFSNQVINTPDPKTIPKGMKLVRAFKFFEDDPKTLESIQNAASMIIQEDKIEGTLCMSVHPLDYLSASENTHNWRSCHALDGDYRAGNLSYMVDHCTIMCYLKSSKPERLPNFPEDVPWNSKKWRVLFYFADNWDMIFAGRQYPFTSDMGLDYVKNEFLPFCNLGKWSDWCKNKIRNFEEGNVFFRFSQIYIPLSDELISLNKLVVNEPNSLQFNDILSSSCYDPLYAFRRKETLWMGATYGASKMRTRFHVGGGCKCLRCGVDKITITSSFMCDNCELEYGDSEDDSFAYCNCCGRRYFYDDGIWVAGSDECVCPDCADRECMRCECCNELYYTDDLIYYRREGTYVCPLCYEELEVDTPPEDEENEVDWRE